MQRELGASIRIEEVGDLAVVTAQVSLELAAKLRVVLDHYRNLAYHRGATVTGDGHGAGDDVVTGARDTEVPAPVAVDTDPVTGDPIVVTNAELDARALGVWVDSTLGAGLGTKAVTEHAHLDVVVTMQDLLEGTGSALLARTDTTVSAQRTACDAHVRVVLVDGVYHDSRTGDRLDPAVAGILLGAAGLLDYGRAHRIVPTRLRRALAHRDRGCAFPGCGRPPAHTEAHHILAWEHGGATSLANCVLLCSRHHHYVHEGDWRITLRTGRSINQAGCWQFSPPDRQCQL